MSMGFVIIVTGCLVAASCALTGSFLVLRRLSLLGDAISHSVLPGIVLAFLWTGSRAPLPMILGATILGLVTVVLVERLTKTRRLHEDASIGVVFPALFSIGVILISTSAFGVDLDLDCVLFGEIGFAPFKHLTIQGTYLGPKAFWVGGGALLFNLLLVIVAYKELKITTFDPDLAASLGISPTRMHYVLMIAVSITIVSSFEAVGAILVVAMLIVPPAAAYLWTDRLSVMLVLSVVIGCICSIGGYGVSAWANVSISGSMASAAGAVFLLSAFASPRYGVVSMARAQKRLRYQFDAQLLLNHLDLEAEDLELELSRANHRLGWGRKPSPALLRYLFDRKWIVREEGAIKITSTGKDASAGYHPSGRGE